MLTKQQTDILLDLYLSFMRAQSYQDYVPELTSYARNLIARCQENYNLVTLAEFMSDITTYDSYLMQETIIDNKKHAFPIMCNRGGTHSTARLTPRQLLQRLFPFNTAQASYQYAAKFISVSRVEEFTCLALRYAFAHSDPIN